MKADGKGGGTSRWEAGRGSVDGKGEGTRIWEAEIG